MSPASPLSAAAAELETLIRARYPLLHIASHEEQRVEEAVAAVAARLEKKAVAWSCTKGLRFLGAGPEVKKSLAEGSEDPLAALKEAAARVEPSLYLFKDFHPYLTNPEIVRALRELARQFRASPHTLILLSPHLRLPPELEKDVTLADLPLPDAAELGAYLDKAVADMKAGGKITVELDAEAREKLIKGLSGLTLSEAENVLAKSVIGSGRLDGGCLAVVLAEKKQIIRKSGVLEYYDYQAGLDKIGGLKSLKAWLSRRALAFSDKARDFGLPPPKGVLLLGIQGCGKSLCAKTASAAWKQPLLRLDMSRIFGSLVGSSEANLRAAIQVAESVAPAILWVDEIDKGFSGVQSSAISDAGTTARVFGAFITWLQEKTAPVFVIATANNVSQLPAELLRKGRFDEIFFVDLPDEADRREIMGIHLANRGREPARFDLNGLAAASAGFSGAEIEQAVVSALFEAFAAGRELETADLREALLETVPLSKTMAEQLDQMREWARARARPAA